ncbi:MAG: RNA polymerase sigma factor [Anaerolineales bacterium]
MSDSSAAAERAVIERALRGDAEAYGQLIRQHQGMVFNVCYRMLNDWAEAENASQETFIRAHARLATFDLERPFGPWIRRVAANLCLNRLEARHTTVALDEERDRAVAGDPETARAEAEQTKAVRAAVASLPPHYRAVIELRHFQDLSYDESVVELKLSLSDVKSHLFRARKMLAEKLKRDEASD